MIKLSPQTVEFNGEELLILEGRISELQVSETTENLLEQLQKNPRRKATAVGAGAAIAGMANIVASSSGLVFYDGEDTYNFAALVNGQNVVCGTFSGAATFKNGEMVRFVVAKRGQAYFAHAAYRLEPKVLMIPSMTFHGDRAYFRSCMRTGRNIATAFTIIFNFVFIYDHLTGSGERDFNFLHSGMVTLIALISGFSMEYWTYNSTKEWGLHGSAIFKALGIPRPDDFTLRGHLNPNRTNVPFGYLFEEALEAHLKRYPELASSKI